MFGFLKRGTPHDQFAQIVMKRMKSRGWKGDCEYVRQPYSLKLEDDRTIFLENVFRSWSKAAEAEKLLQVDIAIGHLFEAKLEPGFLAAVPFLRPAIRNRSHLSNVWLTPGLEKVRGQHQASHQPFCEQMAVVAVIDSDTAMRYVDDKLLKEWGVTFETVLTAALENLRAISVCKFVRDPGGFWISAYGDHYDNARLLLPHLFEQLEVQGDPVALVVDRAAILVAGADDSEALKAMAAFAVENRPKLDRPISSLPIVLSEGEWRPFDTGTLGFEDLDKLRVQQVVDDAAEQHALLLAHHARAAEDIFVAKLAARSQEGATIDTLAVWPDGVDTLLPRADVIMLGREENGNRVFRNRLWTAVEAEFGPFQPVLDLYPLRYRFRSWPADAWKRAQHLAKPEWDVGG